MDCTSREYLVELIYSHRAVVLLLYIMDGDESSYARVIKMVIYANGLGLRQILVPSFSRLWVGQIHSLEAIEAYWLRNLFRFQLLWANIIDNYDAFQMCFISLGLSIKLGHDGVGVVVICASVFNFLCFSGITYMLGRLNSVYPSLATSRLPFSLTLSPS